MHTVAKRFGLVLLAPRSSIARYTGVVCSTRLDLQGKQAEIPNDS